MALIEFGFGISAISGKIGDTIYARNRGGAYAKEFAKPVQPNTGDQMDKRGDWQTIATAYASLSTDALNTWHDYAKKLTRLNRIGGTFKLTGQQIFTECYANALFAGLTPILLPSQFTDRPAINSIGFFLSTEAFGGFIARYQLATVLVTCPSGDVGTLLISAAPSQRASVRNVNNQFRLIKAAPAGIGVILLNIEYQAKFGNAMHNGWNSHVQLRLIDGISMLGSTRMLATTTVVHDT